MTVPAQPSGPPEPRPGGAVTPGAGARPAAFTAGIAAEVRRERGLALRAGVVLAVLAVIFLLRALFTG
jgi:hypothetical protein